MLRGNDGPHYHPSLFLYSDPGEKHRRRRRIRCNPGRGIPGPRYPSVPSDPIANVSAAHHGSIVVGRLRNDRRVSNLS